jgi:predicted Zn-dependent peptidase
MVMTGTGSRYENAKENGMAHFLEHMLFKGTQRRKTAKDIAEELDGVGGQCNAFTGKDHTAYYAKVDKRHFDVALDVISDIFLNPTLPAAEIEKERGAVIEEINMYEDMPIRSVLNEADATLFGSTTSLGRTILGPKKNIQSFTRSEFVDYFTRNYVAKNSALCIAGSFSKTRALKEARRIFATMREGDVPTHAAYNHEQGKARVSVKHKKTDQTHFVLSVPSYPLGHTKEIMAQVLAAVLGGGMSSRLFTEIRERRGLAYYVRADSDVYDDIGALYVRAGVGNDKLEKAVEVTITEIKKLLKAPISAFELRKAKEYIKGTAALALETTDAQADYIGYATLVRNSTEGLDAFNAKVDKVTARQICRVAGELFSTNTLNLTVIGPHKDEMKLKKLLRI